MAYRHNGTEVPCLNGKLYIAPVFDCYDGAIVGLTMDDNMCKELCIQAFEDACKQTGARGMILHSDRGSQFTSGAFRSTLKKYEAIQSMSSVGRCYDNCRMESFFADTQKGEAIQNQYQKILRRANEDNSVQIHNDILQQNQNIHIESRAGCRQWSTECEC